MARNAEKAMTALGKFYTQQMNEKRGIDLSERRPFRASQCDDLKKAEKWRRQVVKEVSKKIAEIQNAGLGEFRLRDMNDEINKLLREKSSWEERIVQLGGRDFRDPRHAPKIFDKDGNEVAGNRGYRYFGAAREIPGVKEMLTRPPAPEARKTRAQLGKHLDPHYFGYLDEDDGEIVPVEQEAEKKFIADRVEEWRANKSKKGWSWLAEDDDEADEDLYAKLVQSLPQEDVELQLLGDAAPEADAVPEADVATMRLADHAAVDEGTGKHISDVEVISQEMIEQALIRQKKQQLLERYASSALIHQSEEARALLGLQ